MNEALNGWTDERVTLHGGSPRYTRHAEAATDRRRRCPDSTVRMEEPETRSTGSSPEGKPAVPPGRDGDRRQFTHGRGD